MNNLRLRIKMLRPKGQWKPGQCYNIPEAEALTLIHQGFAVIADKVGPSEFKPSAPSETKTIPAAVKPEPVEETVISSVAMSGKKQKRA